jgi:apolipoprotein D and lipocalin family protein
VRRLCVFLGEIKMRIFNNTNAHVNIWFGIAMLGGLLGGCAGIDSKGEVSTVASVDLSRYAGTWYEIARLPMWFQRHCVDSKAVYTVRADGAVGVHNECMTDRGGVERAEGVATVVDAKTNARLNVVFDNWFARFFGSSREGNYWILDLDAEYQTAVVGTPDRRYLWILARAPKLDGASYRRLVEVGRGFGYPTDELIHDRRLAP